MKEKVMDKNKKKIVKKKDIEKIMQKIMRKLSISASVSLFSCSDARGRKRKRDVPIVFHAQLIGLRNSSSSVLVHPPWTCFCSGTSIYGRSAW